MAKRTKRKAERKAAPHGPYVADKPKPRGETHDVCHRSGELMWNSGTAYPVQLMADRFNEAWRAGWEAAMSRAITRKAKVKR